MTPWDSIWLDAHLATMQVGGEPYGTIRDGALGVHEGRLVFVGPLSELPDRPERLAAEVVSAGGGWITPGLIDAHTHLVFGGNRIDEFEERLAGASYAAIAERGGGILSTVRATRAADEDTLVRSALARAAALLGEGVTTLEVKSGYGLDPDTELRMLRAGRRVGATLGIEVVTTFLGAHAIPTEYGENRAGYLRLLVEEMLPRAVSEGLADAVDAFLEPIAFRADEVSELFHAARKLGLPLRLHADQLSDGGGAALAARWGALSADHLEFASDEGVRAMAEHGTVAVLLPGALYTLGSERSPPVERFRTMGVPMALATDLNPGSSPVRSLLLVLNLGCTLLELTPEEALAGVTRHGAAALGLDHDRGTLEPGKRADFVAWEIERPAELAYWAGGSPEKRVVVSGSERIR